MVIITNEKELQDYVELLFVDLRSALERKVSLDETFNTPLIFRLPSTEEEPYITYSWMQIFSNLQEEIYAIISQAVNRPLTHEEKLAVELKIYVRPGSNIYEIFIAISEFLSNLPAIPENLHQMTPDQILNLTLPFAIAWAVSRMFSSFSRERSERHKANIDAQILANNNETEIRLKEIEKETIEIERKQELERQLAFIEGQNKALEVMKNTVEMSLNTAARTARAIQKIPDVQTVEINGENFTQEDFKFIGKRKPRQKFEEEVKRIQGQFMTTVIQYPESDNRIINIDGTLEDGSPYSLKDLPVNKDLLTPEIYELINEGKPLWWDFTIAQRGEKMTSIVLKEISEIQ